MGSLTNSSGNTKNTECRAEYAWSENTLNAQILQGSAATDLR